MTNTSNSNSSGNNNHGNGNGNGFVHPDCLEGLEILRKHNLVFLNTPQVDIFAGFCQPGSGMLPSNGRQSQADNEESKETTFSSSKEQQLVESWQSDKMRFDASSGRLVLLDLGGRRLHRGLPCDPCVFGKFRHLKTLSLAGTDLPVKDILAVLGVVFATNSNENDDDDENKASALESLFLGGCGLGSAGAEAIATSEWFRRPNSSNGNSSNSNRGNRLTKLDLRYNDIGSAGVTALCRAMMGDNTAIDADATASDAAAAAAAAAATTDSSSSNLQYLYVEGNGIGDEGCEALAEFLSSSLSSSSSSSTSILREIYLGSNTIGPSGARALAGCLAVNNTLTKLYLESNALGPEGALAFCQALEDLRSQGTTSSLKHLYVDNNQIGKEVSNRLAKALRSETAITDIYG